MKDKMTKPVRAFTIIFVCAVSILGIFYFVDTVWNGAFVDWFTRNYMQTYNQYSSDYGGNMVIVTAPKWDRIKALILNLAFAGAVICPALVMAVSSAYARKREEQAVKEASRMIQKYMNGSLDASEVFPEEYAAVSAQMAEIKAAMQRHEQIIRDETARKTDLITYLAHDLKTPLTSVIGYLSLLDEAPDMPEKQKEKYVGIALDKAYRLEKLIQEFFEITRYNLQQMELEKETIDLYYMLAQMTDEFYPLLQPHGNEVSLRADENLTVYGDPAKLARVFNNILKNAISYSYPNTPIEIWTENTGDEIRIYFRNKGKTISAAKLDTIFEKFFRLDESRRTNTGGAGLGLAIAKEIVTLHGGRITAKSEREFTTFCVALPG